ncbi:hypothetical protein [Pseudoduganella sp. R-43]
MGDVVAVPGIAIMIAGLPEADVSAANAQEYFAMAQPYGRQMKMPAKAGIF